MKKLFIISLSLLIALANCSSKKSNTSSAALALALGGSDSKAYSAEKFYSENTTKVDDVMNRYADIAFQTYTQSLADAINMSKSIQTFIANPDSTNLISARKAWVKARASYLLAESFRFANNPITSTTVKCDATGKATTGGEECEGVLNAWPLAENSIDKFIKDTTGITFAKIFLANGKDSAPTNNNNGGGEHADGADADVKVGWHPIEYLLWGNDNQKDGAGTTTVAIIGDSFDYSSTKNKTATYLSEISDGLVKHLAVLKNEWKPNYQNNHRNKVFLKNKPKYLDNVFKGLGLLIVGEIGGERLTASLGVSQEKEHSCFSDNTKADFYYDIQGIINLWNGKYELKKGDYKTGLNDDGKGLKDLVKLKDSALAKNIGDKLTESRNKFCLNIDYNSDQSITGTSGTATDHDPNYKTSCDDSKTITGRYDQVTMTSNPEHNELKAVEQNMVNLRSNFSKAAKSLGIGISNFTEVP